MDVDDLGLMVSPKTKLELQIYIRYDLQDGAEVCAKFTSDNEHGKDEDCLDDSTEQHEDEPDDFSYSCSFEHLPPLILTCVFPQSYPSKDPPHFVVTAKWMDGPNVSRLCEMLDAIWAELPGQEVVYQWVEWIRTSSLLHLGFDSKITLGPDIHTHKGDNRAISRSLSLESVIPSMLSYSSQKCYQIFLEDLHMCMICLNQTKGKTSSFLTSFLLCSRLLFLVLDLPWKNATYSMDPFHIVLLLNCATVVEICGLTSTLKQRLNFHSLGWNFHSS
jgi:E3 ubiquitin-protein ligase RNF14